MHSKLNAELNNIIAKVYPAHRRYVIATGRKPLIAYWSTDEGCWVAINTFPPTYFMHRSQAELVCDALNSKRTEMRGRVVRVDRRKPL